MNTLVWGHVVRGSHTFHVFNKLLKVIKKRPSSTEKQNSGLGDGKTQQACLCVITQRFLDYTCFKKHFLDQEEWADTCTYKQQP